MAEVLNAILIPALIGLGGLIVWLVKFYIPAIEKRKDLELESELREKDDKREHFQATENVAIDVLREITRESIQEHSRESQEMRNIITDLKNVVYRLGRQVDNNSQAVRALAGVIEDAKKD